MNLFQVDAFTAAPFSGNPAAVCLLDGPRGERWMQRVAAEFNLSETAFVWGREDGYDLRWFTPRFEVDLCGHATLASAHVLWEEGHLPPADQARFHTKSGLLTAERRESWIELDFPSEAATTASAPPGLFEALGLDRTSLGKNRFAYLIELESEEAVRSLRPEFGRLAEATSLGVMVTSEASGDAYDFVSRYFLPSSGIDEDPVTGSAHCCLGPHWRDRLGKDEFLAFQASTRGGEIRVRVARDRVHLGGPAVTVLQGELLVERAR